MSAQKIYIPYFFILSNRRLSRRMFFNEFHFIKIKVIENRLKALKVIDDHGHGGQRKKGLTTVYDR